MKLLALAAILPLVVAAPSPEADSARVQLVNDHFYEGRPVGDFMQHRRNEQLNAPSSETAKKLDWTTDGCSVPGVRQALAKYPGLPKFFDFADPCTRNDFAYRNYPKSALNSRRNAVDKQFLEDMKAVCATSIRILKDPCLVLANSYYAAVRIIGAEHFGQKTGRAERVHKSWWQELQSNQTQDILNSIEQAGQALEKEKSRVSHSRRLPARTGF
ncbi:prokaryotic phospholipase A2 domain-containing protein [Hirsutella rhossiliensis]|uniref:Prokaryotic phospholipase a2 domain-containing protein n=1 Tax=Hirsutella rhossiliensis TaxID=111463 RepID=A0A9P8SHB9_9HYPO|nr:prokaryotic phospholipase a2 domain-containing protein [Hirsutella rhossiliensis]KAH0962943.1 prokaryotic phospholipase a2 domain-containing protein [Hirsutella rhossiliensis]